jgi:hypothetical protein
LRQAVLVTAAVLAYFGIRGLTEGDVAVADSNARRVLDLELTLGLDLERGMQDLVLRNGLLIDLANWVYIWGHWPVLIGTLVWLVLAHRDGFYELRNAIFISGAIGLVIFALFPVSPPRLLSQEYVDTVTEQSNAYRVLQPPGLINKYAAVPSLHFGWNLLVGIYWYRLGSRWPSRVAAFAVPTAMALAVVATANHWVIDTIAGAVVALTGLALERRRRRWWLHRSGSSAAQVSVGS